MPKVVALPDDGDASSVVRTLTTTVRSLGQSVRQSATEIISSREDPGLRYEQAIDLRNNGVFITNGFY